MENILSEAIGEIKEVIQMAKSEEVSKYVPTNAQFVTIATVMVLSHPQRLKLHFSSENINTGIETRKGFDGEKYICYLFHDGQTLTAKTSTDTVFAIPLTNISSVDMSYAWGFLLLLKDSTGIAVGQVGQVQLPDGSTYRTTPGASDQTGNWYKEFVSLGVISQAEDSANRRGGRIFLIIWAVLLIGMLYFLFFHGKK